MPLANCFWLQMLPLFFGLIGTGLILIIGIERLTCIAFPIWLAKRPLKNYFIIFSGIARSTSDISPSFC